MIIRENKYTTESSRPRRVYENLIARYAFYYRSFAPPARRRRARAAFSVFAQGGQRTHAPPDSEARARRVSSVPAPHCGHDRGADATVDPRRPRAPDSMYFHHRAGTPSWFPYGCLLCELCMYRLKKTLPRGGWQRSTGRYSDRKSSQSARKPNSFYILSKFAESGKFQDPPTSAIVPHCTTR